MLAVAAAACFYKCCGSKEFAKLKYPSFYERVSVGEREREGPFKKRLAD